MRKFESSQKQESKALPADSSKACSKPRALSKNQTCFCAARTPGTTWAMKSNEIFTPTVTTASGGCHTMTLCGSFLTSQFVLLDQTSTVTEHPPATSNEFVSCSFSIKVINDQDTSDTSVTRATSPCWYWFELWWVILDSQLHTRCNNQHTDMWKDYWETWLQYIVSWYNLTSRKLSCECRDEHLQPFHFFFFLQVVFVDHKRRVGRGYERWRKQKWHLFLRH